MTRWSVVLLLESPIAWKSCSMASRNFSHRWILFQLLPEPHQPAEEQYRNLFFSVNYYFAAIGAHFSHLFSYLTELHCLCPYHIWQDCPPPPSPTLLVNTSMTCIHGAAGTMQDASPLLFPEQWAGLINSSDLLNVWQFAYFLFPPRAPHQLVSTWQP